MGAEAAVEQALKTAFRVYTDPLAPGLVVTYRTFFLNDETDSETEERTYPYIQIHAAPSVPAGHKSTFVDVAVEVKWATHKPDDLKKAIVRQLYENIRTIIDGETGVTVTGYSLIAVKIEEGGESDVEDNEQFITIQLTVKLCGA